MSFADLKRFGKKYQTRQRKIFHRLVQLVFESIVEGSHVTGAPGQPVHSGNLRGSWIPTWLSETKAMISSGVEYALIIEDNARGATFRNHGAHSVRLTRLNFQKLAEQATREILASET